MSSMQPAPVSALQKSSVSPSRGGMGHVLLISPLTFTYHESITETLKGMGYAVTWWNERASSATFYKVALRLFSRITKRWSEPHFMHKLAQLDTSSVTDVLVIKGEGLSPKVIRHMRNTMRNARFSLYFWDSVENIKGVSDSIDHFDSVASFDPQDAASYGWHYRPLFARRLGDDEGSPQAPASAPRFDWVFIGTLHSDRHRVIHALRTDPAAPKRSFVFGFFPSKLVKAVKHLTDWTLWSAPKGTVSTKAMNMTQVNEVISATSAVLDVEHPRQRGLTMRTIETLLAGKKLLTTNRHIESNDLYDPSRVHVISRRSPVIPQQFLDLPFKPIPSELRSRYSCEGWATELLGRTPQALRPLSQTLSPSASNAS